MGVSLEIQPDLGPVIHAPIRDMAARRAAAPARARTGCAVRSRDDSASARRARRRPCRGDRLLRRAIHTGVLSDRGSPLARLRPGQVADAARAGCLGGADGPTDRRDDRVPAGADRGRAQTSSRSSIAGSARSRPRTTSAASCRGCGSIFDALRPLGAPTIYFGTGNASLLELMAEAGSDLMSVDWRVRLDDAWRRIGFDRGIQGNLDPVRPVAGWEAAEAGMREVLAAAGGRPGHVFNLGHGVLPETDPDVLRRLVDAVHSETAVVMRHRRGADDVRVAARPGRCRRVPDPRARRARAECRAPRRVPTPLRAHRDVAADRYHVQQAAALRDGARRRVLGRRRYALF